MQLGDIENALVKHSAIASASVLVKGSGMQARLVAFVVPKDPRVRFNLLPVKQHCAQLLPSYMIVDDVVSLQELPLTSSGKVDRNKLANLIA